MAGPRPWASTWTPRRWRASQHNAALNGLGERLQFNDTPLAELIERFPLVVANLTALDLRELAPLLAARLAPSGQLIVSGLLVTQIEGVRAALEAQGLTLLEQDSLAAWASLVMG